MFGSFGEDFDHIGDTHFGKRLDRFDHAEFEMQAFVGAPFHPTVGFCKYIDGSEESL